MEEDRTSAQEWSWSRRRFLLTGGSFAVGGLLGCRSTHAPVAEEARGAVAGIPTTTHKQVLPKAVDLPAPATFIAPTPDGLPGGRWPAPDFSAERVLRYVAGIRPYRRGSIRIEADRLHDRPLIHNYGHGGAGITLSPGSALEVLEILTAVQPQAERVAVLGCGVNGLTVAARLVEAGFKVRVYAENFPPNTTSNIAGGQFAPSIVAHGQNDSERERFRRCVRRSFDHYATLLGPKYGVFARLNYTTQGSGSALRQVPRDEASPVQTFEQLPIQGVRSSGYAFKTFLIEPPIYLARLHADLVARGVTFHSTRFEVLDDLRELPEDAIVNCLGLGAGDLFDDAQVVPIRGQLVHLEQEDLPYLLSHSGYLFPRSDVVVLGGTVERGMRNAVPSSRRCDQLLRQHRRFFEEAARSI